MGIPKFFRWLRYLESFYKGLSLKVSDTRSAARQSQRQIFQNSVNPITLLKIQLCIHARFSDNFYLDMNGIFHNCAKDVPGKTEEQIFASTFAYIQALVSKIRPKKLLFLAVDGEDRKKEIV